MYKQKKRKKRNVQAIHRPNMNEISKRDTQIYE